MPGMMDTILNLGLNDEAVLGLGERTGNPRFANDSYRRLIQMYGEVVDGIDGQRFEDALVEAEGRAGRSTGRRSLGRGPGRARRDLQGDLRARDRLAVPAGRARPALPRRPRRLRVVGEPARAGVPPRPSHRRRPRHRGQRRPDGVRQQGRRAPAPASRSRATRRPASPGSTASSWPTRRARTSSPGIRTPEPLERMQQAPAGCLRAADRDDAPARAALPATCRTSSSRSRTTGSTCSRREARSGPRPPRSRAPWTWSTEGLISREDAVARIDPDQLDQLLHPMIDPAASVDVIAQGLNASPGAACGYARLRRRRRGRAQRRAKT